MSVNRSILKKSRHIGIGLLQCNLSTLFPVHWLLYLFPVQRAERLKWVGGTNSWPGEYWLIYRGSGFLAFIWYGSSPTPYLPFPTTNCLSFSVFLCVAGRAHWQERGGAGGLGRSQIIRLREKKTGPLYIIQYSLSWQQGEGRETTASLFGISTIKILNSRCQTALAEQLPASSLS